MLVNLPIVPRRRYKLTHGQIRVQFAGKDDAVGAAFQYSSNRSTCSMRKPDGIVKSVLKE